MIPSWFYAVLPTAILLSSIIAVLLDERAERRDPQCHR